MGYNGYQRKMKKLFIAFVILAATITLSSFTSIGWYKCRTCDGKGWQWTKNCSRCNGKGTILTIINCPRCNGNGFIRDSYGDKQTCPECNGAKKEATYPTCTSCQGSGEEKMPCRACNGKGEVWINE